ncbi:MAG: hypothetical protein M1814_006295 [Vezdaea aestivalis]|nr:MAG: hypothetical protein M1814_006295 [Vezdaea aestivalis]
MSAQTPSVLQIFYMFSDAEKAVIDPYGVIAQVIEDIQKGKATPELLALFTQVPAPLAAVTKIKKNKAVKGVQKVNKRSVNSYMTFRAFYHGILPKVPQKDISIVLKPIWDADPFQSKWVVMAKSYSLVRNALEKGGLGSSFELFLAVSKDVVGVIAAEDYLSVMGWKIVQTSQGPRSVRVFDVNVGSLVGAQCSVSVKDIVENFYNHGHIPEWVYNDITSSDIVAGQGATETGIGMPTSGSHDTDSVQVHGTSQTQEFEEQLPMTSDEAVKDLSLFGKSTGILTEQYPFAGQFGGAESEVQFDPFDSDFGLTGTSDLGMPVSSLGQS